MTVLPTTLITMGFSALLQPQNAQVGKKLGLATALMFTLPILTFFFAQRVFSHKPEPDNWAGGAAILMTNCIVGWYCYMAYVEDRDEDGKQEEDNDASRPRVGAFKQRTD